MAKKILEVHELTTKYITRQGEDVYSVDHVSLDIEEGKSLGIAGESGCGKSTLALSLMGYYFAPLHYQSGEIIIDGKNISGMDPDVVRKTVLGTEVAYIPQAAMNAMNPTRKVGKFIEDVIRAHELPMDKKQIRAMAEERFAKLGLPVDALDKHSVELSGGMRQRVVIAIAVACRPQILICDEPTTALDVTIQAQILELMDELKKKLGMGIILITHDLGVVASMCDNVAVMYAGEIVEYGSVDDIFYNPQHEYTRGLLNSIPKFQEKEYSKLVPIEGQPVDLLNPPKGCPFAPRCRSCMKICMREKPERTGFSGYHYARCFLHAKKAFEEKKEG